MKIYNSKKGLFINFITGVYDFFFCEHGREMSQEETHRFIEEATQENINVTNWRCVV